MKYYNLGNIQFQVINGEVFSRKMEQLELFSIPQECVNSDEKTTISVKEVEELKIPERKPDFETLEYMAWKECDTRVYKACGKAYAMIYNIDNNKYVLEIEKESMNYTRSERQMLNYFALETMFLKKDAFVLHSSFIKYGEDGILFTAPSGTGKSTQADLWKEYEGAQIVNGDRTLIRYENGEWKAYGIPFSGSSDYCENECASLKGIVYLSQAKENQIQKLSEADAIKKLFSETTVNNWNTEFVYKIFDLLEILVKDIPVYSFACTKDEDAVKCLKNSIYGE